MHHIHLIHWLMDFLGVNNSYDKFSTKMYNFWSGFGANIGIFALSGMVIGVYRHNMKRLNTINLVHKIEKQKENRK